MFYILVWVVVTQVHPSSKGYQPVHLKSVIFIIWILHCNKRIKNPIYLDHLLIIPTSLHTFYQADWVAKERAENTDRRDTKASRKKWVSTLNLTK